MDTDLNPNDGGANLGSQFDGGDNRSGDGVEDVEEEVSDEEDGEEGRRRRLPTKP